MSLAMNYGECSSECYETNRIPNTSFQRTLTRGGFGPLNSDR